MNPGNIATSCWCIMSHFPKTRINNLSALYLWALYDSLSADCFVILLGDFNGDLGNSLGDKDKRVPDDRGLLLLDFDNFFNICTIDLLRRCKGPLESYNSHCRRYHLNLDYISLPNCLLNNIESAETFELDVDNTSEHLPILVNLRFPERIPIVLNSDSQSDFGPEVKKKVHWSNFSHETVTEKYVTPLLADLADLDLNESNETETVFNTITKLLLNTPIHYFPLALIATESVSTEFMSGFLMMLKPYALSAKLLLTTGSKINLLTIVLYMITIGQNAKIIAWLWVNF